MSRAGSFEISTVLAARQDEVWAHATSFEGINFELGPWMQMTRPRRLSGAEGLSERVAGEVAAKGSIALGKSWVLFLGVLPFDYDDMVLVGFEPGRGFHERSTMAFMRAWEHRRSVIPEGFGTRVTDRLTYSPRALVPLAIVSWIVRRTFMRRHRNLVRRFRE